MVLLCPQCAYENPDQSAFCVRCGNRLSANGLPSNTGPVSGQSLSSYAGMGAGAPAPSQPTYSPPPFSSGLGTPSSPGLGAPAPSQPAYSPPPISSYSPSAALPYSYPPAAQSAPPSSAYPVQMGTGQGQIAIRRAFAGYGTLVLHHSWLVSGGSEQASNASAVILDVLRQRNIVGLNINPQRLMERGLLMEERNYLVARRGVSTMFIYTAPAGKDLYISRATTVLPTISNVRVVIYSILFLIMFIGFFSHPSPYAALSGDILGFLIGSLFSALSYVILPIFLFFLVRSFLYWLVEKDFWTLLRPNTLNDFQLDDIMLLEHVTDDTVKTAVQQIGLDSSQITPPPLGYQAKRRIRTI